MNPSRLFLLLIMAGCCLLCPEPLPAQDAPFGWGKPFSADMIMTNNSKGQTFTQKMYSGDSGKMRTEMSMNGNQMVMISRPDLHKIYQVLDAQKMVMEIPIDPSKSQSSTDPSGMHGKFESIGPDTAEGVACMKYKVTSDLSHKVNFMWFDASTKAPVKMAAEDGSFTILWKNYKAGPQDASLFEPPAGYQIMPLASRPGMPGGAGH